jgi:SanA protein
MKRLIKIILYSVSIMLFILIFSNFWIVFTTKDRILSDSDDLPENRVALVLGTSKRTIDGGENIYFKARVEAAASLYHNGKVSHLLVSGDNRTQYYNEPQDMYNALKNLNVPDTAITLDYAGFRTLDSIVRCIKIFGQDRFTIVTQEFHGHRALFIANHYNADAVVYAVQFPEQVNERVSMREVVARQLALIDLFILRKQPKYLGETEPI